MAALKTRQSEQYGHTRLEFAVPGGKGFVIVPAQASADGEGPWVWYAPSFVGSEKSLPKALHAWYMERLLGAGFAVAGVDVGESWGSPAGRAAYTEFHRVVTEEFGLATRACLFPQSRGGLMHYNWASEHPERVRCVGAIYPVTDVARPQRLDIVSAAYGLKPHELLGNLADHNPLDRLAPLAAEGVPILHLHGDQDELVPLETNSVEFERRYRQFGGPMRLIVVAGKGHEEVPEYFQHAALLEFFLSQGETVAAT